MTHAVGTDRTSRLTEEEAGATGAPSAVRRRLVGLAWVLLAGTIAVQIAFPYTDGGNLALTTASVVLLASTALVHIGATRGPLAAIALAVVAGGGGLIAEAVGIATGFPFGTYDYTDGLGVKLLGVPVLVPLAWIMMSWPAVVVARRLRDVLLRGRTKPRGSSPTRPGLTRSAGAALMTALLGAYALTAWDVFLDPQMVDQGNWAWRYPDPSLPGIDDIPLTNFAGWLLVSFIMIVLLDRLVGEPVRWPAEQRTTADAVPVAAYLWTYFSSVLAHAAFFGRPSVAVTGAIVMGVVAIPLLIVEIRALRARR